MYVIYLITFSIWVYITSVLYNYNNFNLRIAKNQISALHATIVIISFILNVPGTYVYYITFSYFILDSIFHIYYFRNLFNLGIIIHHIITIGSLYYLLDPKISRFIFYPFFLNELSNIPMYI